MIDNYNTVIIGSGIGGLTTASLLSESRKVLVIEKNNHFGGYCSDFERDGFTFEAAVQSVNGLYRGNPVYEILKKSGSLTGLTIASPKTLYRAVFPDYDFTVPHADLCKYQDLLCHLFPRESDNISKLFGVMKSIFLEMNRFYLNKTLKKSPFILKYCRRSLAELLAEFIKDEKLKAIICQYWMYRGLPPTMLSAITFSYIWYDYTANGSYFPEEGMSGIVNNLINRIRKNGGEVLPNKEVSRLHVENGRVTEVELKNGDKIAASIFISNIDALRTFEMIDGGDERGIDAFAEKLENNMVSISAFKVYLGLDINVKDLGIDNYEIFVNPSYDTEYLYKASIDNEFNKMAYSVTIYSNLAKTFCAKDESVLSIGALSGYDYWHNLSRAEYKYKKKAASEILISRLDSLLPGLSKHITTKIVGTPLTMERYTGNSKGSIYGWNKKSLLDEIQFMSPTTPIENLMLSSHWTKMGGGIGGVLLSSDRINDMLNARKSK